MAPGFDTNPLTHMDSAGIFFDMAPASGVVRKGTMIQLAMKLTKITVAALKTFALSVKTGLTGNADFPTPSPSTTDIQTAVDDVTAQEVLLKAAEDKVT